MGDVKETANQLKECIKVGKLKEIKRPWHKYLEGKTLILFELGGAYNLLAIKGEEQFGLKGLCKYSWENDIEAVNEEGYEKLEDFIEEVNFGNDGFGFDKDEIELCDIEEFKKAEREKRNGVTDEEIRKMIKDAEEHMRLLPNGDKGCSELIKKMKELLK